VIEHLSIASTRPEVLPLIPQNKIKPFLENKLLATQMFILIALLKFLTRIIKDLAVFLKATLSCKHFIDTYKITHEVMG
jgi:hypothetical protein